MLKRIFILGRIEYYSLIKKIFEYYSNTWKYSNIRIYSNKFAKNVRVSEPKLFTHAKDTFKSERIFHMLTLINKNYRSTPCSQNIVQILSLFLKNSSIFPSNNFWIFRPKYSNIRIIFGFWKCPRIEYEYQYSEENIRIFEYIRIFVCTLIRDFLDISFNTRCFGILSPKLFGI